jgi:hypothetical protein
MLAPASDIKESFYHQNLRRTEATVSEKATNSLSYRTTVRIGIVSVPSRWAMIKVAHT